MQYYVTVYVTGALTYLVEADSAKQAGAKYKASDNPERDFGKPSESLVGTEDSLFIERAGFTEPGSIVPEYPGALTAER